MKANLNRRDFLKILGSASAGTFLGSALPIYRSYAQSNSAPLRLLILPKELGWMTRSSSLEQLAVPDSNASHGFRLPWYFSSLERHKQKMLVIENLRGVHWGNAHDHSFCNILTNACVQGEMTSKQLQFNEPMGPSIDWVLGNRLKKDVLRINLGLGRGGPLCFDDKFMRQPMDTETASLYDSVIKPILAFQNGATDSDLLVRSINQTLFETVGRDTEKIQKLLQGTGHEERKLESFKRSLAKAHPNSRIVSSILAPIADPGRTAEVSQIDHAFKIVKAAFMADTKRVAVVGLGGGARDADLIWTDGQGVAQTGMSKINQEWRDAGNTSRDNDFHHLVSHYNWGTTGNPQRCLNGAIKYYIDKVATLVDDLSTTMDIDGRPMIENTCIVMTSEISEGTHDTSRMPMIIIGGNGAGGLKLGRYITGPLVDTNAVVINTLTRDGRLVRSGYRGSAIALRTQGDVFVSIARAMGVPMNTFGFEPHNTEPFNLTG